MPGATNVTLGILGDICFEQFGPGRDRNALVLAHTHSEPPDAVRLLHIVLRIDASKPSRIIPQLLAQLAITDEVTVARARRDGRSNDAGLLARLGAQVRFVRQVVTDRRDGPRPDRATRTVGGAVGSSFRRQHRRHLAAGQIIDIATNRR